MGRIRADGTGSFSQAVAISVPGYRGLEPRLALVYSSQGSNGFVGVGWGLSGLSTVVSTRAGRGTPRFDASDVFLLDGQELVPCQGGSVSPSCTSGGTHSTKNESYLKIRFDSPSKTWSVWGKDGTRSDLTPVYQTTLGNLRWGQTLTVDTHGNTVNYAWACQGGDCYPDSIIYNAVAPASYYSVKFFREARPDPFTFAIGDVTKLGQTAYRLRSILVTSGGAPVRAYQLTYGASAMNGRSRLIAVQQYGRDVAIDAAGAITGGTRLPPRTFTYQDDPAGKALPGLYESSLVGSHHLVVPRTR